MKNSIKRKIAFLLCMCMLIASCSLLASCAKKDNTIDESFDSVSEFDSDGEFSADESTNEDNSEDESEDKSDNNDTDDTDNETTTDDIYKDIYEKADVGDIIITKVYGNNGNADAPVKASFIELYNTSDRILSLNGYSLYYGEGKSFSCLKFNNTHNIEPQEYFLIKCNEVEDYSGKELMRVENYDINWNIKIDNKEFEIVLAKNDADIKPKGDFLNNDSISSYVTASLEPDVDIYRVDDLSKNKVIVRNGLTNDVGYSLVNLTKSSESAIAKITPKSSKGENSYIDSNYVEVKFSREGGVYEGIFDLELSAPEGYKIYYTMNGTEPIRNLSTVYSEPLKIANTDELKAGNLVIRANKIFGSFNASDKTLRPGGVVVKAMAVSPDGECSGVFTETYFVSEKIAKSNAIVFSISIKPDDLLSETTGAYVAYRNDLWGTRPRSRAFLEVFSPDGVKKGGSYMDFAVSGNGSSGHPMKSLRIYYKDPLNVNDPATDSLEYNVFGDKSKNILGQNISTFERILIRNSGNDYAQTYIRDAYVQRLACGLNVDSLASTSAIVFMNGELWGVYNLRERYSPEYFHEKYGVLEENVVIIENESPLKYDSAGWSWNNDYVAATGDAKYATEFNNLVAYIKSHDMSDPSVYNYVSSKIDVDSFIDYMIFELYFCNNDWPGNNIKVWKNIDENDPSGMDTKWRFVLLDMDHCCGYGNFNNANSNFFDKISEGTRCGAVMAGFMKNAAFKLQFANRAYELINTVFDAENALYVLNEMAAEKRELLAFQFMIHPGAGSYSTFDSQINVMRTFIENRAEVFKAQVKSYTGVSESKPQDGSVYLEVRVDTSKFNMYISGDLISSNKKIKYKKGDKISLKVTAKSGYKVSGITLVKDNGESVKYDGSTASITLDMSCQIIVRVSSNSSGENLLNVSHGLYAGLNSSYFIDENGDLYAWGQNSGGILGVGTADSSKPLYVMSDVAKVAVTKGFVVAETNSLSSTAILTRDGTLYTVGNNSSGQLGRTGSTSMLTKVEFDKKIVDVSVGQDYMLIIDEDGDLWGVGNNTRGQLGGKNVGSNVYSFQKMTTDVKAIAAGRRTTLYVKNNGDLYALGDNRWNKVSTDNVENITVPKKIGTNIRDVVAGSHQFLVIDNNNDLYYIGWRRFDNFQQGYSSADLPNGVMYKLLSNVKSADIQEEHIVALTNDGKVYGYGLNTYGELIISGNIVNKTPKLIYSNASSIAAGNGFTLILTSNGKILCYGRNTYGQAGNGSVSGTVNKSEITKP